MYSGFISKQNLYIKAHTYSVNMEGEGNSIHHKLGSHLFGGLEIYFPRYPDVDTNLESSCTIVHHIQNRDPWCRPTRIQRAHKKGP